MARPHRSLDVEASVELAVKEIERLGHRLVVEEIGSAEQPLCVARLVRDGPDSAVGYGKGRGGQQVASAYFEALEDYHMSSRVNRRCANGAATLLTAAEVAGQPALANDLVIQRWATEFPASVAACAAYRGRRSSVRYPLFLADPRYHRQPFAGDTTEQCRSLLRYSSSLGTAAGVTVQDATLGGLCELIEHDGLSLALLGWFIARAGKVARVDQGSLPDRLRWLHERATSATRARVSLVDVTTDVGVPVYLAIKDDGGEGSGLLGMAASPHAEHAAERALDELIQIQTLRNSQTTQDPSARLAAWPTLRECARLHVGRLPSEETPLGDTIGDATTATTSLNTVAGLLSTRGIEHYVCELAPPDSHVAVVSVIAPGLDRFSLVHHGVPVLPTGRGWRLWTAAP